MFDWKLDPMPTPLVLECLDVLLPVITRLTNLSSESGSFPDNWKHADVHPGLKKNSGSELVFFRTVVLSVISHSSPN